MRIRGRWLAIVGAVIAVGDRRGRRVRRHDQRRRRRPEAEQQHQLHRLRELHPALLGPRPPLAGVVTVKFNGTKHYDPGATLTLTSTVDAAGAAAGIRRAAARRRCPTRGRRRADVQRRDLDDGADTAPNGTYTVTVTAPARRTTGTGEPVAPEHRHVHRLGLLRDRRRR